MKEIALDILIQIGRGLWSMLKLVIAIALYALLVNLCLMWIFDFSYLQYYSIMCAIGVSSMFIVYLKRHFKITE
jgi:hypothetical protein